MGQGGSALKRLLRRLRELRTHMRAEQVDEIARRYLVMNAFDGALAILSVVVSAYFAVDVQDPRFIVAVGLANCLAMGISGFTGTFMTERAERLRRLKEIENLLLTDLGDTDRERASLLASVYVALIDGLAPMVAAAISLSPFIIAMFFPLDMKTVVYVALAMNMATLFTLGAFLGRVSKENIALSGLKMVLIGCGTALLCVLLKAI
ncbi:MAG TPA: hypothetical protein ENG43_00525 [Candidatus Bathyarchaeota archaeon]|nr:hypothetical protein [Candidatus Bathyarchaeota archaeon]HEW89811.1 hypothetical protein [Candidatus Bathyarchaeota archaeon]